MYAFISWDWHTKFKNMAIIWTSNTCQLGSYCLLIIRVIHLDRTEYCKRDTSSRSAIKLEGLCSDRNTQLRRQLWRLRQPYPTTSRIYGQSLAFLWQIKKSWSRKTWRNFLNRQLTQWSRIFLQKLIVAQLVNKSSFFYGIRRFNCGNRSWVKLYDLHTWVLGRSCRLSWKWFCLHILWNGEKMDKMWETWTLDHWRYNKVESFYFISWFYSVYSRTYRLYDDMDRLGIKLYLNNPLSTSRIIL